MLCFSSEALRHATSKPGFIILRRQDHLPHCFYCTGRRIPRIVTSARHALCFPGHSPNHQPPHHHGKVGNNHLHALSLRVDAELIIIIAIFWPLYGSFWQDRLRDDMKQDVLEGEWHTAKRTRPGLEPRMPTLPTELNGIPEVALLLRRPW